MMIEIANKIGSYDKVNMLLEIGGAFTKNGQKDMASKILSQSIEMANTIKSYEGKSRALCEIATKYSENGQFADAIEVANEISDDKK